LVHEKVFDQVKKRLVEMYSKVPIGDPLKDSTLCGPLHSKWQIDIFNNGVAEIKKQGGKLLIGGKQIEGEGNYVEPTIFEIDPSAEILKEELFVPILYLMKFSTLD